MYGVAPHDTTQLPPGSRRALPQQKEKWTEGFDRDWVRVADVCCFVDAEAQHARREQIAGPVVEDRDGPVGPGPHVVLGAELACRVRIADDLQAPRRPRSSELPHDFPGGGFDVVDGAGVAQRDEIPALVRHHCVDVLPVPHFFAQAGVGKEHKPVPEAVEGADVSCRVPRVCGAAVRFHFLKARVEHIAFAHQRCGHMRLQHVAVDQEVSVGKRPGLVEVGGRAGGFEAVEKVALEVALFDMDVPREAKEALATGRADLKVGCNEEETTIAPSSRPPRALAGHLRRPAVIHARRCGEARMPAGFRGSEMALKAKRLGVRHG